MTVGDIISILEQFPREREAEFGLLSDKDQGVVTVIDIADIILSEKHILLVDTETSKQIQAIIGAKLTIRGKKTTETDEEPEVLEVAPPTPIDAKSQPEA